MSINRTIKVTCEQCQKESEFEVWDSINTSINPEMHDKVLQGEQFIFTCPFCGAQKVMMYQTLYHDAENHFMVSLSSPNDINEIEDAFKKNLQTTIIDQPDAIYKYRIVHDIRAYLEKIQIFDDGLDDRIIELMKCVYATEFRNSNPDTTITILYHTGEEGTCFIAITDERIIKQLQFDKIFYKKMFDITAMHLPLEKEHSQFVYDQEWATQFLISRGNIDTKTNEKDKEQLYKNYLDVQKEYFKTEYALKKIKHSGINDIDEEDGETQLTRSIEGNDFDKVKELIEQGADVSIKLSDGETPMHKAFSSGASIEIIKLLMENGADINCRNNCEMSPLEYINEDQPVEYLKSVLELGAKASLTKNLIELYTRYSNNIECVKYLINIGYSIKDIQIIQRAIYTNLSDEFIVQLIELGADPNIIDTTSGEPCFFSKMMISMCSHKEEVANVVSRMHTLFLHGADVNLADKYGTTAFEYACSIAVKPALVEDMLQFHPDLKHKDSYGKTARDYISRNSNLSDRAKKNLLKSFDAEEQK